MEEGLGREEEQEEVHLPLFLDLMHRDRESARNRGKVGGLPSTFEDFEDETEKELELTLGPSGGEFPMSSCDPFSLTLQFPFNSSGSYSARAKRGFSDTLQSHFQGHRHQPIGLLEGTKLGEKKVGSHAKEGEPFSKQPFSIACTSQALDDKSSSIRAGTSSMVGWPPIRSSRKNLTSSSFNSALSPSNSQYCKRGFVGKQKEPIVGTKSLLVKINLEGYPIGRKVDLMDFCDYEGLSATVQQLFRGLLSDQRAPSSVAGNYDGFVNSPAVTGMLDGTGDHILVYEDNEGDRMLAGDVPWNVFVSTAKRLRILKSSDLPSLSVTYKIRVG